MDSDTQADLDHLFDSDDFQSFFNDFFADGGEYRNYVQVVSNTRTVVKSGKKYKIGATVTVSKEQLRRDLEAKGILKGLNTGF